MVMSLNAFAHRNWSIPFELLKISYWQWPMQELNGNMHGRGSGHGGRGCCRGQTGQGARTWWADQFAQGKTQASIPYSS